MSNDYHGAFEKWAKEHAKHLDLKRDGNWLERYWTSATHHAFDGFQAAAQIWNDSWELKAEQVAEEVATRHVLEQENAKLTVDVEAQTTDLRVLRKANGGFAEEIDRLKAEIAKLADIPSVMVDGEQRVVDALDNGDSLSELEKERDAEDNK